LALLAFAMLIVSLDQYIVVVALPNIGRDLGFSAQTLQAVVTAYAIASGGFLLLGGRTADLLGRRRVLVTGLALYAASALAGGLAQGQQMLLAHARSRPERRPGVFHDAGPGQRHRPGGPGTQPRAGRLGGAGAAGLVVGVLLGGILTRAFGWQAVILINAPLAAAALLLAFPLLDADTQRRNDRSFDVPGALSAAP
jgi:MFS family permease